MTKTDTESKKKMAPLPSWCLQSSLLAVHTARTLQLKSRFSVKTKKKSSYLRNYVLQPTKYANAVLSGDKVLAIPSNSWVGRAAKLLLIVKQQPALPSIFIVILTSGLVIRRDVLFQSDSVDKAGRGKGVGLGLWFWRGYALWPAIRWYGQSIRGFELSWGPQAVE